MESKLECSICLNSFSDPRFLSCFHTFCLGCLESYTRENSRSDHQGTWINCPICRAKVFLPVGGVQELQANFYIEPKPGYPFCTKHPEEDLRFYCLNCNEIICRDCKVDSHDHHETKRISTIVSELMEKVETILQTVEKDIYVKEEELSKPMEIEVKKQQNAMGVLKTTFEELKESLQSVFQAFIDFSQPQCDIAEENLLTINEWAKQNKQNISEYRTMLKQELDFNDDTLGIIGCLRQMIKNKEQIQRLELPKISHLSDKDAFNTELEKELRRFAETVLNAAVEVRKHLSRTNEFLFEEQQDEKRAPSGIHLDATAKDESYAELESTKPKYNNNVGRRREGSDRIMPKTVSYAAAASKCINISNKRRTPTGLMMLRPITKNKHERFQNDSWINTLKTSDEKVMADLSKWSFQREKSNAEMQMRFEDKAETKSFQTSKTRIFPEQTLFVGSLSQNTEAEDIKKCFREFGTVVDVTIKKSAVGSKYCFVTFASEMTVQNILRDKPPIFLKGNRLNIDRTKYSGDKNRSLQPRVKGNSSQQENRNQRVDFNQPASPVDNWEDRLDREFDDFPTLSATNWTSY